MLYEILKPFVVGLMRLLFRLEGRGTAHVPRTGPVLLVANHSSFLDPPLVASVLPRQLAFLAKAELFDVPLLGGLIRRLNAQPLRREGADAGALRTALRLLQEGKVLLLFPEGTRGPEGTLRPPKPGAAMLATLSGATVVPVFIRGSGRAWPRERRFLRPAKVTVSFGAPMVVERRTTDGRKPDYEAISREMMAAIGRLAGPTTPRGTDETTQRVDGDGRRGSMTLRVR